MTQALYQTIGHECLQRRGGGDVDRRQEYPGGSDHAQAQIDARCRVGNRLGQHRLRVRNVRSHTDHVSTDVAEKENVVNQMLHCLAGQADHDPGADDIADRFEHPEAGHAFFVTLGRRMQGGEQGGRGALHAQQIAMCAGSQPFGVGVR